MSRKNRNKKTVKVSEAPREAPVAPVKDPESSPAGPPPQDPGRPEERSFLEGSPEPQLAGAEPVDADEVKAAPAEEPAAVPAVAVDREEAEKPAKLTMAHCIRECCDSRDFFERGKIYPIVLETHPCREHFELAREVSSQAEMGPPGVFMKRKKK